MTLFNWGNLRNLDHSEIKSADLKFLRYLKETNLEDVSYIVKDCFNKPNKLCMRSLLTNENNKTCQYDHGSPLVLMEDGRFTVIGLFSYYSYNSKRNLQNVCESIGVYTKISPYLDSFIKKHVNEDFCYF